MGPHAHISPPCAQLPPQQPPQPHRLPPAPKRRCFVCVEVRPGLGGDAVTHSHAGQLNRDPVPGRITHESCDNMTTIFTL